MPTLHDKIVGHAYRKIIDPKINLKDYEIVPPQAVASTRILMEMRARLGDPGSPFTPSGEKLMNLIIAIWEDGYPKDAREWYKEREEYQRAELDISTQVKRRTGRSLASFPGVIYSLTRQLFPGFDPAWPRKTVIKMVRKWPMFRFANRV